MSKTVPIQILKRTRPLSRSLLIVLTALVLVFAGLGVPRLVNADSLQEQIVDLQEQNAANRAAVASLKSIAVSYEDAIATLQKQISDLQVQIDANEAEQASLEQQIAEAQAELDAQKAVLGENIKTMYLEGKISTVEMLATSKNLSEYIDKETYRNAVQKNIQETLAKITALKTQLSSKKLQVEVILSTLNTQRSDLDNNRAEQASLLSYNKQQQAQYNADTKNNQAKINQLNAQIAAQASANNIRPDGGYYFIRFPGSAGSFDADNYPYKYSGFNMSTAPGCGNVGPPYGQRDATDRWGYCTRQCVSYAAWAVEASGRSAPRNYGSAKNWVNSAPASYIYRTPQPGDVAISTSGTWGHAMYVEDVSDDGSQIYVSQYNQQLTGQLSYQWRSVR